MTKTSFCVGAPHKFTEETCKKIILDIKKSLPYHVVAESNGIHYNTFAYWLRQGRDDIENNKSTEKSQFYCEVKKAVKEVMDELLEKIRNGTNGWQGSAWILERRWWKDWSSKVADLDFNERLSALENEQKNKDGNNEQVKVSDQE